MSRVYTPLEDAEWHYLNEVNPAKRAEAKARYLEEWEKVHGPKGAGIGGNADVRDIRQD